MAKIELTPSFGIPAKYANRHGLIAGATGTGKTVTLQKLAESFSAQGVPVFMVDIKGDIAGLAMDGKGKACPVAFYDVYGKDGAPLRLSLQFFGCDLLARVLNATDAQAGLIESVFEHNEELDTLESFFDGLQRLRKTATRDALARKVKRFARNGGNKLFTKQTPFCMSQFFQYDDKGQGYINILDAQTLYNSPSTYAALMSYILSELFRGMPEAGDLEKPRFVLFIDEAHLLFQDAPPEFLQKIERTVRLIRSKGVGVYFVTQSPADVPAAILGQLGNRVQHALRGATLADQKAIRAAGDTMPANPNFKAADIIGRLGVGEALAALIGENGTPAPCERIKVSLPACRLGAISDKERRAVIDTQPKNLQAAAESIDGGLRYVVGLIIGAGFVFSFFMGILFLIVLLVNW